MKNLERNLGIFALVGLAVFAWLAKRQADYAAQNAKLTGIPVDSFGHVIGEDGKAITPLSKYSLQGRYIANEVDRRLAMD